MSCKPILYITDGETKIDLLGQDGIYLDEWRPSSLSLKGGGIMTSSMFIDGSEVKEFTYENRTETFRLRAKFVNQDRGISVIRELDNLLVKARKYTSTIGMVDSPVYLAARGTGETNTRYAMIKDGRINEYQQPHGQPFLQPRKLSVWRSFTLAVQIGHWMANPPLVGTPLAIGRLNREGVEPKFNRGDVTSIQPDYILVKTHTPTGETYWYEVTNEPAPYTLVNNVITSNAGIFFGFSQPVEEILINLFTPPYTYPSGTVREWLYFENGIVNNPPIITDSTSLLEDSGRIVLDPSVYDDWKVTRLDVIDSSSRNASPKIVPGAADYKAYWYIWDISTNFAGTMYPEVEGGLPRPYGISYKDLGTTTEREIPMLNGSINPKDNEFKIYVEDSTGVFTQLSDHINVDLTNGLGSALYLDAIYFGLERSSSDGNNSRFNNLQVTIHNTVGNHLEANGEWQYWDSTAWVSLSPYIHYDDIQDFTFITTTKNSRRIAFNTPMDWQANWPSSLSPLEGFYIRWKVDSFSTTGEIKTVDIPPYIAEKPYVTTENVIGDDIGALFESVVRYTQGIVNGSGIHISSRSLSRGNDFRVVYNYDRRGDVGNDDGIEAGFINTSLPELEDFLEPGVMTLDHVSNTGQCTRIIPGTIDINYTKLTITIDKSISPQWAGSYIAVLRVFNQTNGWNDEILVRLSSLSPTYMGFPDYYDRTNYVPIPNDPGLKYINLGRIVVPEYVSGDLAFYVDFNHESGITIPDLHFGSLFLIPNDELYMFTTTGSPFELMGFDWVNPENYYLYTGSINRSGKKRRYSYLEQIDGSDVSSSPWMIVSNNIPSISNSKSRIWVLHEGEFDNTFTLKAEHVPRYISMRGDE